MCTAKKTYLLFAAMLCCFTASAQSFGVSTNVLGWGALTPNVGLDVGLAKHWSAEIDAGINPFTYSDHRSSRFWAVQPELKYWFREKFSGPSVGLHGTYGMYDFGLWKYIYKGSLYGGGLSLNYAWVLGERLNLEASLGGGFTQINQRNKTLRTDPLSIYGPAVINKWGLTRAGISLTYFFGKVNPNRSEKLAARARKAAERRWARSDYEYIRAAMLDAMKERADSAKDTVVIIRETIVAPEAKEAPVWEEVREQRSFELFFGQGSDRPFTSSQGALYGYLFDPAVVSYAIRLTARCSPEGGPELNEGLARRRADRIRDQLTEAGIPPGKIEILAIGEDWDRFLDLVTEAPLAEAAKVLDILRNGTSHEAALAKAAKACPEDWESIVDRIFPKMRNVTVVVDSVRKVER